MYPHCGIELQVVTDIKKMDNKTCALNMGPEGQMKSCTQTSTRCFTQKPLCCCLLKKAEEK